MVAFNKSPDVLWSENYEIQPVACGLQCGKKYLLTIKIVSENQEIIAEKTYPTFLAKGDRQVFEEWQPKLSNGYYAIEYQIEVQ